MHSTIHALGVLLVCLNSLCTIAFSSRAIEQVPSLSVAALLCLSLPCPALLVQRYGSLE